MLASNAKGRAWHATSHQVYSRVGTKVYLCDATMQDIRKSVFMQHSNTRIVNFHNKIVLKSCLGEPEAHRTHPTKYFDAPHL